MVVVSVPSDGTPPRLPQFLLEVAKMMTWSHHDTVRFHSLDTTSQLDPGESQVKLVRSLRRRIDRSTHGAMSLPCGACQSGVNG